jgi:hypothetical protein
MNDTLVSPSELFSRSISIFNTARTKYPPREISIGAFLQEIIRGRWRMEVGRVRSAASKTAADAIKLKHLPAAKLSGTFTGLSTDDFVQHSGVLCLDLDAVGNGAAAVREVLTKDPHVLAVFTSPSGNGLKVLVAVSATTAKEHRACFDEARDHFSAALPAGIVIDTAPSNVSSNCFASFDPETWRASAPRKQFLPTSKAAKNDARGCDIDTSHVIQSNEKEFLPSALSVPVYLESHPVTAAEEERAFPCGAPPAVIRLPNFVDADIWPKWVKKVPYVRAKRNLSVVQRAPILINIVAEDIAALLLLRWFTEAPENLFHDSREAHWRETWAAIRGCVESWPKQARITRSERSVYTHLRDARQRATFRVLHSLSVSKKNAPSRTFFIPTGQLADRLNCASEPASRQLEYMVREKVIEIVSPGAAWTPGVKGRATTYRWLLS